MKIGDSLVIDGIILIRIKRIIKIILSDKTNLWTAFIFYLLLDSNKKSLRGIELNSYKYIVIQEVNFNYYRKTAVKVLKKAGFNVVNLHKTSRTHKVIPSDLKQNPDLGLYLHLDLFGTFNIEAQARFFNYNNELLFNSSGGSSISQVRAVKNALSPFETYDYKYNPNIVRKKQKETDLIHKRRESYESNIELFTPNKKITLYDFIRAHDADGYPKTFIKTKNFRFELFDAYSKKGSIYGKFKCIKK